MGKGGGSPPAPTPPGETAKADYGADVASAGFGLEHGTPNQFSPGGSVTFDKYALPDVTLGNGQMVPGGEGVSNVYTSFSPSFQNTFDTLSSKGNQLASNLPSDTFNPNINTEGLRQSYVDEALRNVQPAWQEEFGAFKQDMANRGLPVDSQIWNSQIDKIGKAHSDFLQNVTDQSHQAAAADESRQMQLALAKRNAPWTDFLNYGTTIQSMLAALQGRDTPLIGAQSPNVDVAGATARYDQQRYNNWAQQQQNTGSLLSGVGSIAGAIPGLFAMSDERTKEGPDGGPPVEVGETNDDQKIYAYTYKDDPPGTPMRMGLLAQNVEVDHPEAVATDPVTGFKMVNYHEALKNSGKSKRA